eukprot:365791-Chlamydomonas_euryale.AAC.3
MAPSVTSRLPRLLLDYLGYFSITPRNEYSSPTRGPSIPRNPADMNPLEEQWQRPALSSFGGLPVPSRSHPIFSRHVAIGHDHSLCVLRVMFLCSPARAP